MIILQQSQRIVKKESKCGKWVPSICTNKKGVTHIQLHPMTQVLRELPLPKVEITIAYFNDDAARAESIIGLGSKGKIRLLLYFVNV